MRTSLAKSVLEALIDEGILSLDDSVLAVCAAAQDRELFLSLGFTNVTISNLDDRKEEHAYPPFQWSRQDAQNLSFDDRTFDFAFVSAGIHHCQKPHAAVVEMYRVSRKGIIVIESRDSWIMSTAQRVGLASVFEINTNLAKTFRYGGVNNSHIPNHVYRWTEREFIKTLRSYDPTGSHTFRFVYGLTLPNRTTAQLVIKNLTLPLMFLFRRLFKKQCNDFAMVGLRPSLPGDLWPWLKMEGDVVDLNREYVTALHKRKKLPPN